jgi:hypothetical protein
MTRRYLRYALGNRPIVCSAVQIFTPLLLSLTPLATASEAAAQDSQVRSLPSSDRSIRRPDAQAGQNNTVSYIERSYGFNGPPGAVSMLEFDYQVNSERNWDYLRLWIGNEATPRWKMSGTTSGHKVIQNIGTGTVRIRFDYMKDGSVSVGGDYATVDNVRASVNGFGVGSDSFNVKSGTPGIPYGWTAGGTAGGWRIYAPPRPRGIRRPNAQYGVNNSTSELSKQITWPTNGPHTLSFDYFVDSETNYDYLKVYDGQTLVFSKSGRNQAGTETIPLSSGGLHTIKFQYTKDSSVSSGLDTARVDNIVAKSHGMVFERFTFNGIPVGGLPSPEWSGGGTAGSWVVWPTTNHKTFVPRQVLPEEPEIDALYQPDTTATPEYPPNLTTAIALPDYGSEPGEPGTLYLLESDAMEALYLQLRVKSANQGIGNETGTLTLYFDALHMNTINGNGCGANNARPGREDRKIVLTFNLSQGQSVAQPTITHWTGMCSDTSPTWVAATDQEKWDTVAMVREPDQNPGYVMIEVRVTLKPTGQASEPLSSGRLGLGVRYETPAVLAPGLLLTLPYKDGADPLDNDVFTWETINLFNPYINPDISENNDRCCIPGR